MLGKRIATAVVGALGTVFLVHYGQEVFSLAVLIFTLLAWYEFCRMMSCQEINGASILGVLFIILIWGTTWLGNSQETVAVLVAAILVIMIKAVLFPTKFLFRDAAYTIIGIMYIAILFSHLLLLRFTDASISVFTHIGTYSAGEVYFWVAILATWASDTFAYFVGSFFGKHKLAPLISPGKTWEGLGGGVVGSVFAALLIAYVCSLNVVSSGVLGLLIGIVAPLGDLVESILKRSSGVKDSSQLIPGHGGVLDRFDSILFAVPVVYYYIIIVGLR